MHTASQDGNLIVYRIFLTLQWMCIYTQFIGLIFNAKKLKETRNKFNTFLETHLVDMMKKEVEELKKIDNDNAKKMITIYESIINNIENPISKPSLWTKIKKRFKNEK
jgi:hypothetical protein